MELKVQVSKLPAAALPAAELRQPAEAAVTQVAAAELAFVPPGVSRCRKCSELFRWDQ
jgi:hypothetical protein